MSTIYLKHVILSLTSLGKQSNVNGCKCRLMRSPYEHGLPCTCNVIACPNSPPKTGIKPTTCHFHGRYPVTWLYSHCTHAHHNHKMVPSKIFHIALWCKETEQYLRKTHSHPQVNICMVIYRSSLLHSYISCMFPCTSPCICQLDWPSWHILEADCKGQYKVVHAGTSSGAQCSVRYTTVEWAVLWSAICPKSRCPICVQSRIMAGDR